MFRTVYLSIIRSFSVYTQQCYMSYSLRAANLYDIYHCRVYGGKPLMMDRGTVRNMQNFIPKINLRNQCIWLVLLQESTRDKEKKINMYINVAISGDRNVIKRESQKILQHKHLTEEIQRWWNLKTNLIPAITVATGTISQSFRQ